MADSTSIQDMPLQALAKVKQQIEEELQTLTMNLNQLVILQQRFGQSSAAIGAITPETMGT